MIIKTWAREEEDLELLSNTLNAEAGRFLYSDNHLYCVILRAQAAILELERLLDENNNFCERIKERT